MPPLYGFWACQDTKEEGQVMERVRLETADGHYVATGIVPPFQVWPEMMVWGSRSFQLVTQGKTGDPTTYREVCCFVITQTELG